MVERGRAVAVVHRFPLLLQPGQLPLDVGEQHVREIVAEPASHHDAKSREVITVLRERVSRQLPAALTQRVRDVEDGEVVDRVLDREGEDRQLVARVISSKGPNSAIWPDSRVATSRA